MTSSLDEAKSAVVQSHRDAWDRAQTWLKRFFSRASFNATVVPLKYHRTSNGSMILRSNRNVELGRNHLALFWLALCTVDPQVEVQSIAVEKLSKGARGKLTVVSRSEYPRASDPWKPDILLSFEERLEKAVAAQIKLDSNMDPEESARFVDAFFGWKTDSVHKSNTQYTDDVFVREKIAEFAEAVGIPNDARANFSAAVDMLIAAAKSSRGLELAQLKPLPNKAPEPYAKRKDQSETIVEFLARVWGPWLDGLSMTRADLRRLDEQAAKAVENWLDHDRPFDLKLPTKAERNDALLALGPQAILSSPDLARVYSTRLKRKLLMVKL